MTFDLLEDGDKFRTVGIVTGKLGLYVYTKRRAEIGTGTEGQLPNGNAVAFEGTHKEKWEFFSGHQRVEKV